MAEPMMFPKMALVKQSLCERRIGHVPSAMMTAFSTLALSGRFRIGDSVGVAVGSRGINRIDEVLRYCIRFLAQLGLKPFIIAAMGSHGGATESGQRMILDKLGITASRMGVPVDFDMAVVGIDTLPNGLKIFFSKKAFDADHLVVINRIKPHTKFKAEIGSGLCKMLTIGLGKAAGAAEFHRCAVTHSFRIIEDAAKVVLEKCRLLFGVALLEDGLGHLARIEAISPEVMVSREKTLLTESTAMMGRIPFDNLDVLIIDRIGKDISGIGMDSNITGRHRDITGDFDAYPHVKRIFVRDLSPNSDGNGNGIGLADFTTRRFVDALDLKKTYINALTAISPEKAAIPMYFETDREALVACLETIGMESLKKVRMVRIRDTGSLSWLQVSEALKSDVLSNANLTAVTSWRRPAFDHFGNLCGLTHGF